MKKEHILIIRFSAIGDVAMAVPVVYSLAMQYPKLRITVLSRAFARPFFEDLAPNVSFMEADLKHEYHGIKGLNALYRRLTAKNFTAIADLHNVLRSEFLRMRFSLDHFHVEHINKYRKGRKRLISYSHKRLEQQPTSFQKYSEVLAKLGYPVDIHFHSIFPYEGGDLSLLPDSLKQKGEKEVWIGIAPYAAHDTKVYPIEQMKQVLTMLIERHPDARLFLFGRGEREEQTFDEWASEFSQCVKVSSLIDNLRLELVLMSHLNVMVSMDSANMHLASMVATPVVSIWGATHPYAGFMGWGQEPDSLVQVQLACRPCSIYGNKPCKRGDLACLTQIAPETIIDKIEKYI